MKILNVILWWIFILSIPLLLISATVSLELQCLPFYEYAYQKYRISEVTGFDGHQLKLITCHLIQFFNGKVESVQLMVEKDDKPVYLFHDYEIEHLEDVKLLFQTNFKIQMISLLYFLVYLIFSIFSKKQKKWIHFWKGLRNGSILTISLLVSLGVFVFLGFHQLFIHFHYLVFGDPQSSPWILDPRIDHLVMMYPLNFWQDAAILGIVTILVTAIALIGICWIFLRKYRNHAR